MKAVYTLEGTMCRRPGAPTNRFVFTCEAETFDDALELLERFLNPEKNYKITSINGSILADNE